MSGHIYLDMPQITVHYKCWNFRKKKGNRFKPIPLKTSILKILTLGKLKAGPGAFLAVFLSFFDPGITFYKAGSFKRQPKVGID
jgi:hypothetical protein